MTNADVGTAKPLFVTSRLVSDTALRRGAIFCQLDPQADLNKRLVYTIFRIPSFLAEGSCGIRAADFYRLDLSLRLQSRCRWKCFNYDVPQVHVEFGCCSI